MNKKDASKLASELGKLRWKGKSKEERAAHGRAAALTRWAQTKQADRTAHAKEMAAARWAPKEDK